MLLTLEVVALVAAWTYWKRRPKIRAFTKGTPIILGPQKDARVFLVNKNYELQLMIVMTSLKYENEFPIS